VSIPSLRGSRYTGPYGHDGRTASLAEFVQGVVTVELGGAPLPHDQLAALVRYVQDLDFLPNAKLDPRGGLSKLASEKAQRGALLFAQPRAGFSGMSCATCHAPTTFFRDGRVHRLGTGSPPSPHAMDGGYETPTLLGSRRPRRTSRRTLRDDRRGHHLVRRGLLPRPRPSRREDLTAYVDAVGAVDRPHDDRPLARRLDETFAYVSLLTLDRSARSGSLRSTPSTSSSRAHPRTSGRGQRSSARGSTPSARRSRLETRATRSWTSRARSART